MHYIVRVCKSFMLYIASVCKSFICASYCKGHITLNGSANHLIALYCKTHVNYLFMDYIAKACKLFIYVIYCRGAADDLFLHYIIRDLLQSLLLLFLQWWHF